MSRQKVDASGNFTFGQIQPLVKAYNTPSQSNINANELYDDFQPQKKIAKQSLGTLSYLEKIQIQLTDKLRSLPQVFPDIYKIASANLKTAILKCTQLIEIVKIQGDGYETNLSQKLQEFDSIVKIADQQANDAVKYTERQIENDKRLALENEKRMELQKNKLSKRVQVAEKTQIKSRYDLENQKDRQKAIRQISDKKILDEIKLNPKISFSDRENPPPPVDNSIEIIKPPYELVDVKTITFEDDGHGAVAPAFANADEPAKSGIRTQLFVDIALAYYEIAKDYHNSVIHKTYYTADKENKLCEMGGLIDNLDQITKEQVWFADEVARIKNNYQLLITYVKKMLINNKVTSKLDQVLSNVKDALPLDNTIEKKIPEFTDDLAKILKAINADTLEYTVEETKYGKMPDGLDKNDKELKLIDRKYQLLIQHGKFMTSALNIKDEVGGIVPLIKKIYEEEKKLYDKHMKNVIIKKIKLPTADIHELDKAIDEYDKYYKKIEFLGTCELIKNTIDILGEDMSNKRIQKYISTYDSKIFKSEFASFKESIAEKLNKAHILLDQQKTLEVKSAQTRHLSATNFVECTSKLQQWNKIQKQAVDTYVTNWQSSLKAEFKTKVLKQINDNAMADFPNAEIKSVISENNTYYTEGKKEADAAYDKYKTDIENLIDSVTEVLQDKINAEELKTGTKFAKDFYKDNIGDQYFNTEEKTAALHAPLRKYIDHNPPSITNIYNITQFRQIVDQNGKFVPSTKSTSVLVGLAPPITASTDDKLQKAVITCNLAVDGYIKKLSAGSNDDSFIKNIIAHVGSRTKELLAVLHYVPTINNIFPVAGAYKDLPRQIQDLSNEFDTAHLWKSAGAVPFGDYKTAFQNYHKKYIEYYFTNMTFNTVNNKLEGNKSNTIVGIAANLPTWSTAADNLAAAIKNFPGNREIQQHKIAYNEVTNPPATYDNTNWPKETQKIKDQWAAKLAEIQSRKIPINTAAAVVKVPTGKHYNFELGNKYTLLVNKYNTEVINDARYDMNIIPEFNEILSFILALNAISTQLLTTTDQDQYKAACDQLLLMDTKVKNPMNANTKLTSAKIDIDTYYAATPIFCVSIFNPLPTRPADKNDQKLYDGIVQYLNIFNMIKIKTAPLWSIPSNMFDISLQNISSCFHYQYNPHALSDIKSGLEAKNRWEKVLSDIFDTIKDTLHKTEFTKKINDGLTPSFARYNQDIQLFANSNKETDPFTARKAGEITYDIVSNIKTYISEYNSSLTTAKDLNNAVVKANFASLETSILKSSSEEIKLVDLFIQEYVNLKSGFVRFGLNIDFSAFSALKQNCQDIKTYYQKIKNTTFNINGLSDNGKLVMSAIINAYNKDLEDDVKKNGINSVSDTHCPKFKKELGDYAALAVQIFKKSHSISEADGTQLCTDLLAIYNYINSELPNYKTSGDVEIQALKDLYENTITKFQIPLIDGSKIQSKSLKSFVQEYNTAVNSVNSTHKDPTDKDQIIDNLDIQLKDQTFNVGALLPTFNKSYHDEVKNYISDLNNIKSTVSSRICNMTKFNKLIDAHKYDFETRGYNFVNTLNHPSTYNLGQMYKMHKLHRKTYKNVELMLALAQALDDVKINGNIIQDGELKYSKQIGLKPVFTRDDRKTETTKTIFYECCLIIAAFEIYDNNKLTLELNQDELLLYNGDNIRLYQNAIYRVTNLTRLFTQITNTIKNYKPNLISEITDIIDGINVAPLYYYHQDQKGYSWIPVDKWTDANVQKVISECRTLYGKPTWFDSYDTWIKTYDSANINWLYQECAKIDGDEKNQVIEIIKKMDYLFDPDFMDLDETRYTEINTFITEYNKYVNWVRKNMSKLNKKGTSDKKYYDRSVSKFILKDSTEFKNPVWLINPNGNKLYSGISECPEYNVVYLAANTLNTSSLSTKIKIDFINENFRLTKYTYGLKNGVLDIFNYNWDELKLDSWYDILKSEIQKEILHILDNSSKLTLETYCQTFMSNISILKREKKENILEKLCQINKILFEFGKNLKGIQLNNWLIAPLKQSLKLHGKFEILSNVQREYNNWISAIDKNNYNNIFNKATIKPSNELILLIQSLDLSGTLSDVELHFRGLTTTASTTVVTASTFTDAHKIKNIKNGLLAQYIDDLHKAIIDGQDTSDSKDQLNKYINDYTKPDADGNEDAEFIYIDLVSIYKQLRDITHLMNPTYQKTFEEIDKVPESGSKTQEKKIQAENDNIIGVPFLKYLSDLRDKLLLKRNDIYRPEINKLIDAYNDKYDGGIELKNFDISSRTCIVIEKKNKKLYNNLNKELLSINGADRTYIYYIIFDHDEFKRTFSTSPVPDDDDSLGINPITTVTSSITSKPITTFDPNKPINGFQLNFIPFDGTANRDFSRQEYYSSYSGKKIALTNGANWKIDSGGTGTQGACRKLNMGFSAETDGSELSATGIIDTIKEPKVEGSQCELIYENKYQVTGEQKLTFDFTNIKNMKFLEPLDGSVIFTKPNKNKKDFRENILGVYHILGRCFVDSYTTKGKTVTVPKNHNDFVGIISAYYTAVLYDFAERLKGDIIHLACIPGVTFGGNYITYYAFRRAVNLFCYNYKGDHRFQINLDLQPTIDIKETKTALYQYDMEQGMPWTLPALAAPAAAAAVTLEAKVGQLIIDAFSSKNTELLNIATTVPTLALSSASSAAASASSKTIPSPIKTIILPDYQKIGHVFIRFIPRDPSNNKTLFENPEYYKQYDGKRVVLLNNLSHDPSALTETEKKIQALNKDLVHPLVSSSTKIIYVNSNNIKRDDSKKIDIDGTKYNSASVLLTESTGNSLINKTYHVSYPSYNETAIDSDIIRITSYYMAILYDFANNQIEDILHLISIPVCDNELVDYILRRTVYQFCNYYNGKRKFQIDIEIPQKISQNEKMALYWYDVQNKSSWINDNSKITSQINKMITRLSYPTLLSVMNKNSALNTDYISNIQPILDYSGSSKAIEEVQNTDLMPAGASAPLMTMPSSSDRLQEAQTLLKQIDGISQKIQGDIDSAVVNLNKVTDPNKYSEIQAEFQTILDNYNKTSTGDKAQIIDAQQKANKISITAPTIITASPTKPTIDTNLKKISEIQKTDILQKITFIDQQQILKITEYIKHMQKNKDYLTKANATNEKLTTNIVKIEQIRIDIKSKTFAYNNHNNEIKTCQDWIADINTLCKEIDDAYQQERIEIGNCSVHITLNNDKIAAIIFQNNKVINQLQSKMIAYLNGEISYIQEHKKIFDQLNASQTAYSEADRKYNDARAAAQAATEELQKLQNINAHAQNKVDQWNRAIQDAQNKLDSPIIVPQPLDASATQTTTTSAAASADASATQTTTTSADASATQTTTTSAAAPATQTTTTSADASADASATQTATTSADAPADASATQTATTSADAPADASATQTTTTSAAAPSITGGTDKHAQDYKAANQPQIDLDNQALLTAQGTFQRYHDNDLQNANDNVMTTYQLLQDADALVKKYTSNLHTYQTSSTEKNRRDSTHNDIPTDTLQKLIKDAVDGLNPPTTGGYFNNYSDCNMSKKCYNNKEKITTCNSETNYWPVFGWVAFVIVLCVIIYLLYLIFKPNPKHIAIYNFRNTPKSNNSIYFSTPHRPQYV